MRILVVGGAGYIGSHTVRECRRAGHDAVVFDNFATGNPESVEGVEQIHGDILDPRALESAFESFHFDVVFHLAAATVIGESVENPAHYYRNNVAGTLNLVSAMLKAGVERLIYSSTSAVYGGPKQVPLPEDHDLAPCNPYGRSKLMVEQLLAEIAERHPLRFIVLRPFNVAGADLAGDIGEDHRGESHLVPLLFLTALGRRRSITVFGSDYDTPDGTCIRDFVHVTDVARAHLLAMNRIDSVPNHAFNLGLCEGFSVQEVLDEARAIVGEMSLEARYADRRVGDSAALVAANDKARELLGWEPQFSDLRTIMESAWNWHRRHPSGFRSGPRSGAPTHSKSELFGDIAVRLGFVDQDDVRSALDRQDREMESGTQHKLIGMHMLEMGLLSTSQLIEILKYYEEN